MWSKHELRSFVKHSANRIQRADQVCRKEGRSGDGSALLCVAALESNCQGCKTASGTCKLIRQLCVCVCDTSSPYSSANQLVSAAIRWRDADADV